MILYKRKVRFSKFLNEDYFIVGVGSDPRHHEKYPTTTTSSNWGESIKKSPIDDGELEIKKKLKFDRDTNAIMIFRTTDVALITTANKTATLTPVWSFCMGADTPLECSVQCANGPICIFMVTTMDKAFVFETTKDWNANVSQLGEKKREKTTNGCVHGDLIRYKDTIHNISSYWAMVADNLGHLSIFRGNVELDTKEPSNTVGWNEEVVIHDERHYKDDGLEDVLAVCGFQNAKEKTNYFYVLKKTCLFIYMRPAGIKSCWGLWDIITSKVYNVHFYSMQLSEKFDRLFVMHDNENAEDAKEWPMVLSMLDPYAEKQKLVRTNAFRHVFNWTLNTNQTKGELSVHSSLALREDMVYTTPSGLVITYYDVEANEFKVNRIFNTIKYRKEDNISFVSNDDRVGSVSTIASTSIISTRDGKVMLNRSTTMDSRLMWLIIAGFGIFIGYIVFFVLKRGKV